MTSSATEKPWKIFFDQRGAVLLVGVFQAIFLTAMLSYVAGIGETTWEREQLQDAADGTALSSAIIMARGMNFMVFINLIMEVLVMIILILQILVMLLAAVALILTALWMFPAAALVANIGYEVHEISNEAQDVIFEILPVLHMVNGIVRVVTPFVAEADSLATTLGDYKNVAKLGFMIPSRFTLPMESGTYDRLCERAGGDLIGFLLSPLPSVIRDFGESAARSIARQLSAWFCGDGGGSGGGMSPPQVDQDFTHDFPETEKSRACESSTRTLTNDGACETYRQELADRTPDTRGLCSSAPDAGACLDAATMGREMCNPHDAQGLSDYMYTEATINKTFVYSAQLDRWEEDTSKRTVTDSELFGARPEAVVTEDSLNSPGLSADMASHTKLGNPCAKYWHPGNPRGRNSADEPWNVKPLTGPDPGSSAERERLVEPVCGAEMEPLPVAHDRMPLADGAVEVRSTRAVTNIFACSQPRSEKVTVMDWNSDSSGGEGGEGEGGEGGGTSDEDDKAPYLVEADQYLGDEAFQVRAVIIGHGHRAVEAGFAAARWGNSERAQEPLLQTLDLLGRLSLSQAEFFFNAGAESGIRDEWAWNMSWSARLVHFRLPKKKQEGSTSSGEGTASTGSGADPSLPGGSGASPEQLGQELGAQALNEFGGAVPAIPTGLPNMGGSVDLNGGLGGAARGLGLGATGNAVGGVHIEGDTDGNISVSGTANLTGALSTSGLPIPAGAQNLVNQGQNLANQGQQLANQGQQLVNQGQQLANQGQQLLNQGQQLVNQGQGVVNQVSNMQLPTDAEGVANALGDTNIKGVTAKDGLAAYNQANDLMNQGVPSIQNAQAFGEDVASQFNLKDMAQQAIFKELAKNMPDHCKKFTGIDCTTIFEQIDSIGAIIGH